MCPDRRPRLLVTQGELAVEALHVDIKAEDFHALIGGIVADHQLGVGIAFLAACVEPAQRGCRVAPSHVYQFLHLHAVVAVKQ